MYVPFKIFNLKPCSLSTSKLFYVALFGCALLLLQSCSTLRDLSKTIQKPRLSVQDVRVTGFNFQQIELTYDIKVDNPNGVSLKMLAYDYSLDIDQHTLVKGDQRQETSIGAADASVIQVPMTLSYSDVYETVNSLRDADEASYNFLSSLTFDIPVLGQTSVPVRKQGTVPLLKMPEIRLEDFNVESLSFSGADVNLKLRLNNPNGFDINVNGLDYDLMIDGDQWAEGEALQNTQIKKDGITELNIPLSLKFSDMGRSAYRILSGSQSFDYRVKGVFDLNIQQELLGNTKFDFDRSGQLSL